MSILSEVESSPIVTDLHKKVVGIYGRAGIGKSTLASCFDGAFFAATEAGLGHLEDKVKKAIITAYDAPLVMKNGNLVGGFKQVCREFLEGDHEYKSLVIDTWDNLVKLCGDWKCAELGINDVADYKRNGAYHLITAELHRVVKILSESDYGLILVSHRKEIEQSTPAKKWSRSVISQGGQSGDIMVNICDPLLFMDSEVQGETEIGVIRTKPSIYWQAKDKLGVLPEEIKYKLAEPEKAYEFIKGKFNGEESK
jgi:energy-coupling factor transporter ATP-binding protein EcfA2